MDHVAIRNSFASITQASPTLSSLRRPTVTPINDDYRGSGRRWILSLCVTYNIWTLTLGVPENDADYALYDGAVERSPPPVFSFCFFFRVSNTPVRDPSPFLHLNEIHELATCCYLADRRWGFIESLAWLVWLDRGGWIIK